MPFGGSQGFAGPEKAQKPPPAPKFPSLVPVCPPPPHENAAANTPFLVVFFFFVLFFVLFSLNSAVKGLVWPRALNIFHALIASALENTTNC